MELLERGFAFDELHRLLRQAGNGRGSLVLLGGEAGVGKTSVLRGFTTEARASARVLLGHCDPLSTPRALGPLFDVDDPRLIRLLVEGAPRDQIFRTVLAGLTATNRPTVLAIEDVHWADEATLDLLRYLGRRIAATRALAIVTYRDDEIGPRHPLQRLLGDLATTDAVRRLALAPLTKQAVATLAQGSGLDTATLYERTRGNPFFVTEVLAAGGEIAPNVRDAVLARASRLDLPAWALLEAAAVIGSPVDIALLDAVIYRGPGELEACLHSGMLLADGQSLLFRHELAREAILTAIAPPRRAALHREILRALETAPAHRHDAARLAHHAEGAGDATAVLRHAPEAARKAALLGAHREVANQYERALRFASALSPEEQADFLEARSYACYMTAQIDEAIAAREAALAIWAAIGNQRKAGENRCHLARLLWSLARIADAEREAEAAVALLEQLAAGPELAMAYGTLASLSGSNLDTEYAIRLGEKAISLSKRVGTTETHVDALITVGEATLARGTIASGQQQIERAMRLAAEAGLQEVVARAFISLGYGFAECGRCSRAINHFERGIRYCAERVLDLPLHHLTALLARCHFTLGHWDEAERLAHSVLSAPEVAPASRFVALLVAASVLTRRGERGAESLLDEALALAVASGCIVYLGPVHAARAEAAFLSGNLATSVAEARAAYDLAVARGHGWYVGELAYWRWKGGELAEPPPNIAAHFACQISGDWERAAAAWEARGCRYEAAWARAEGDDEAALRAAVATFDALGAQPAAALVRGRLRQLGARGVPRGPRHATRANPAGLTPREVEVVALLAEGCSNAKIADRLFLSPRTVENHVAAILLKLGATTREDAAATAAALGIISQTE